VTFDLDAAAARMYAPPAPPTPNAPTTAAAAPEAAALPMTLEDRAAKFYRPAPPPVETPTADAPTVPTTDPVVADLAALGIVNPEGSALTPEAFVSLHDSVVSAHRATQDAEIAGWEAQTRRDVPQHEITAAEAFAVTHLDAEVRDVLASTGLGSHPGIVKLAAKLSRALSERTSR